MDLINFGSISVITKALGKLLKSMNIFFILLTCNPLLLPSSIVEVKNVK